AAYFIGDDESSRTQMTRHARMLRSFVNLPGSPTILVTCHPVKNPDMDNLVPAGGGTFLNEVDGNLAVKRQRDSMLVEIETHGKWRGPEFAPLVFKLTRCTTPKLIDTKGRLIWTVYAEPVTAKDKAEADSAGRSRQDAVLLLLRRMGALSQ